ncbi:PREDICTED: tripartite motif-containing protein 3-like [Branchiostoma belcheri]|uniref:RING-type E3 ubiquitin transferase n=1 Tax=Branchiostoma belcheri TaxID=7741 RepID=A0A6P5AVV1_BRABE|nr:PREDICTED: tripartite motif-containing protein 3-like [Branchiostoma belcheri]
MASNAISDIADEFLVCQVCLEDFRQPKMLPCLHTFCQPCLEKLLAAEPVGKLDCPTCRQDVPLPQNGVQGLKFNFLVGKLRDILQQQPAGKTPEAREDGVPCTVCEVGNSAQFYCVECTEYLCQTCNNTHRRFKATKSHKVVTVQDLQIGQVTADGDQVRAPLSPTETTLMRPDVAIGNGGVSPKHVKTVGRRGSGDGQFDLPTSLAVTAEGDIVVTDRDNSRLQFLDKDGSFKKKVDLRFKPRCTCVAALTNGELLVTGDGHKIHVLDKQGRKSRVIQVTEAAETGQTTAGVAVDCSGRIIVTIGHQVFVLSPSGDVMLKFGDKGQGQQQLGSLLHVTVNSSNQIIVSDFYNNNMKIFDSTGRHLFTCGSHGSGPGQLYRPYCAITDSEDIILADCGNHRVSLFSRDGAFIRHVLTEEELKCPTGLTLTHDGHLVVSQALSFLTALRFFHVRMVFPDGPEVDDFRKKVVKRMAAPPWNFTDSLQRGLKGSAYSPFLHDAVMLYAIVMNQTLQTGEDPRDGEAFMRHARKKAFEGMSGTVILDGRADREPEFFIWDMDPSGTFDVVAQYDARPTGTEVSDDLLQELVFVKHIVWADGTTNAPTGFRECGYMNEQCASQQDIREEEDKKKMTQLVYVQFSN